MVNCDPDQRSQDGFQKRTLSLSFNGTIQPLHAGSQMKNTIVGGNFRAPPTGQIKFMHDAFSQL